MIAVLELPAPLQFVTFAQTVGYPRT